MFGDSALLPERINPLSTLEHLVETAAKCGKLEGEVTALVDGLDQWSRSKAERLTAVETLLGVAVRAVDVAESRSRHRGSVKRYAGALRTEAAELLGEARFSHVSQVEEETVRVKKHVTDLRKELRRTMEAFWLGAWLPLESWRLSQRLVGGVNELSGTTHHPGKIAVSFSLPTDHLFVWHKPRRLSEYVPGARLQLGTRRRFFHRRPTPRYVSLEELVVASLETDGNAAWLALRRKPDSKADELVLELARAEHGMRATALELPNGRGADAVRHTVAEEDLPMLELFLAGLKQEALEALRYRSTILTVTVEGQDALGQPSVLPLLGRVVEVIAPRIREIAARSPSKEELSIKIQRGEGRRQEVYLRKADLWATLRSTPPEVRDLFAGLDILPDDERRRSGIRRTGELLLDLEPEIDDFDILESADISRAG